MDSVTEARGTIAFLLIDMDGMKLCCSDAQCKNTYVSTRMTWVGVGFAFSVSVGLGVQLSAFKPSCIELPLEPHIEFFFLSEAIGSL